jgi:hypothetical protein
MVTDTVTATDTNSDGLRRALIDITINQGDFTLGNSSPATIQSSNFVDENVGGGLGSVPTNQVAIRIRYGGNDDSNRTFTFGNGVANDIVINAAGGDILIDAVGGSTLTGSNRRSVVLNSDVSMSSLNTVGGSDGVVDLQNNANIGPATLLAGTNRNMTIIGFEAVPPVDPPIVPPIDPPIAVPGQAQDIINSAALAGQETATQVSVTNDQEVAGSPTVTSVNSLFVSAFNTEICMDNDERNNGGGSCAINLAIQSFLGSLMIGGEILE